MVRRRSAGWVARGVAVLVALLLILYGVVAVQQRIFRRRAERLLQDAQSLRVQQSTWQDAQRLMQRWGAWGQTEGECSWRDCGYNIALDAPGHIISPELFGGRHKRIATLLMRLQQFRTRLPGLWYARLEVSFLVQEGRVVRARRELLLLVPSGAGPENYRGYPLVLILTSRKDLASGFGGRSQLAAHPNYRVGAPQGAGCGCLMAKISYTPAVTAEELRKLTSFDLSCLTRLRPCVWLEQLLPTARTWHLYGWPWAPREDPRIEAERAATYLRRGKLPVWVIGRDALELFVVQVLSREGVEKDTGRELVTVRLIGALKAKPLSPFGSTLHAAVMAGYEGDPERHLVAGRRYVFADAGGPASGSDLQVEPYDVLEDSPEVEEELRRGMAQSEPLRGQEP